MVQERAGERSDPPLASATERKHHWDAGRRPGMGKRRAGAQGKLNRLFQHDALVSRSILTVAKTARSGPIQPGAHSRSSGRWQDYHRVTKVTSLVLVQPLFSRWRETRLTAFLALRITLRVL
jgi:hypothetical protein